MSECAFTTITGLLSGLSLGGFYCVVKKQKIGFVIWAIADLLWLLIDFYKGIYAQAFLYFVFIGIWGFINWNQEENKK